MSQTPLAHRIELFVGDASQAAARVYARLPCDEPTEPLRLRGELSGPTCRFSQTLPATICFQDRGRGISGLLAEAVVPDPCFWTPELPFLYRARIEVLQTNGENLATIERSFGIRRLGVRGRSLNLDGERWVPRCVWRDESILADLSAARDSSAMLRVPLPDEKFLAEASSSGVPLMVDVQGDDTQVVAQLRRLARWSAVLVAIVDPHTPLDPMGRPPAGNLLLAENVAVGEPISQPAWAQLAVCEVGAIDEFAARVANPSMPVFAVRRLPKTEKAPDIKTARTACDRLQYDLASIGDFAGYCV